MSKKSDSSNSYDEDVKTKLAKCKKFNKLQHHAFFLGNNVKLNSSGDSISSSHYTSESSLSSFTFDDNIINHKDEESLTKNQFEINPHNLLSINMENIRTSMFSKYGNHKSQNINSKNIVLSNNYMGHSPTDNSLSNAPKPLLYSSPDVTNIPPTFCTLSSALCSHTVDNNFLSNKIVPSISSFEVKPLKHSDSPSHIVMIDEEEYNYGNLVKLNKEKTNKSFLNAPLNNDIVTHTRSSSNSEYNDENQSTNDSWHELPGPSPLVHSSTSDITSVPFTFVSLDNTHVTHALPSTLHNDTKLSHISSGISLNKDEVKEDKPLSSTISSTTTIAATNKSDFPNQNNRVESSPSRHELLLSANVKRDFRNRKGETADVDEPIPFLFNFNNAPPTAPLAGSSITSPSPNDERNFLGARNTGLLPYLLNRETSNDINDSLLETNRHHVPKLESFYGNDSKSLKDPNDIKDDDNESELLKKPLNYHEYAAFNYLTFTPPISSHNRNNESDKRNAAVASTTATNLIDSKNFDKISYTTSNVTYGFDNVSSRSQKNCFFMSSPSPTFFSNTDPLTTTTTTTLNSKEPKKSSSMTSSLKLDNDALLYPHGSGIINGMHKKKKQPNSTITITTINNNAPSLNNSLFNSISAANSNGEIDGCFNNQPSTYEGHRIHEIKTYSGNSYNPANTITTKTRKSNTKKSQNKNIKHTYKVEGDAGKWDINNVVTFIEGNRRNGIVRSGATNSRKKQTKPPPTTSQLRTSVDLTYNNNNVVDINNQTSSLHSVHNKNVINSNVSSINGTRKAFDTYHHHQHAEKSSLDSISEGNSSLPDNSTPADTAPSSSPLASSQIRSSSLGRTTMDSQNCTGASKPNEPENVKRHFSLEDLPALENLETEKHLYNNHEDTITNTRRYDDNEGLDIHYSYEGSLSVRSDEGYSTPPQEFQENKFQVVIKKQHKNKFNNHNVNVNSNSLNFFKPSQPSTNICSSSVPISFPSTLPSTFNNISSSSSVQETTAPINSKYKSAAHHLIPATLPSQQTQNHHHHHNLLNTNPPTFVSQSQYPPSKYNPSSSGGSSNTNATALSQTTITSSKPLTPNPRRRQSSGQSQSRPSFFTTGEAVSDLRKLTPVISEDDHRHHPHQLSENDFPILKHTSVVVSSSILKSINPPSSSVGGGLGINKKIVPSPRRNSNNVTTNMNPVTTTAFGNVTNIDSSTRTSINSNIKFPSETNAISSSTIDRSIDSIYTTECTTRVNEMNDNNDTNRFVFGFDLDERLMAQLMLEDGNIPRTTTNISSNLNQQPAYTNSINGTSFNAGYDYLIKYHQKNWAEVTDRLARQNYVPK